MALVRAALARLEKAVEAPPPAGHNQGPPLTDRVPGAEIKDGVQQVEVALAVSSVEGKRSPAVAVAVKAGQELLSGALRWAGGELAKMGVAEAGQYLPTLFRTLVDVLTALARWLGT